MRIYITIKRHSLPDTPIVWNILTQSTTISELLKEIDEKFPLEDESGEWGLEDYSVELKGLNGAGFECLHYHTAGQVLKENDELT